MTTTQDKKIPQGYKITEVGVIPEDWEVKKMGDVFNIKAGGDVNKKEFSDNKDNKHKYPIYANAISNFGTYGYSSYYDYKSPSITVTARGDVGFAFLRDENFCAIVRLLVLTPIIDVSLKLVVDYINNYIDFENESTGVPQLTRPQISKHFIIYPKIEEQKAIAMVLSDMDELIEKLDKLIAKKKLIKQGAMQELLTGKKRLAGFSGEWEVKKLGEIFEFKKGSGLSKEKISIEGEYRCLLYGELFTIYDEVIKKIKSRTNIFEGTLSEKGDILMPGSTTTNGLDLAIASAVLFDNVLIGGDVNILRVKSKKTIFSEFFSRYLTHIKKYQIAEKTQGITIIHLYGKNLKDIKVDIPSYNEQKAIAQILSDMDGEIEKLEKKKEKYQQIKEGAMQVLLTGRVRLV